MDWLAKVVEGWEHNTQLYLFLGVFGMSCTTLFLISRHFYRTLCILINGYPPETPKSQDCNNDDNLRGVCLKLGSGCRTVDECNETVSKIAGGDDAI